MYERPDRIEERSTRILELSRQDIKNAARLLSLILDAPSSPSQVTENTLPLPPRADLSDPPDREQLLQLARWLFHARKARDRFFHPGLFGEAAWDMLLALYTMDQAGPRLTIANLSKIAGVPTATILRWLQTLEDQALVARRPHPHDRRSALVQITEQGRAAMESYLSETLVTSA